ncbi:MAG: transcription elongation factor GreA [Planctomycetota bacterium]|jgi:transcription elongation factor GreA
MSLAAFVSRNQWTEFEDAWTELMADDGPLEEVMAALRLASSKKQMQRCVALAREHAEILRAADKPGDAARLIGTVLLEGGNPGELAPILYECAEQAWKDESFWTKYVSISGLTANTQDMRVSWRSFAKCLAMVKDAAVFHAKGWGIGLVLDVSEDDVTVKFRSGKRDVFPLKTATDIFEVLPAEDLRSMVMLNPDELSRLLREDHLEVLRNVLLRFHSRAAYPVIKGALSQLGVDGTSFGGWWRKARKNAEASGWFEITGTSTKTQVRLLISAADPAEGMKRSLRLVGDLGKAQSRVRDLLAGGQCDETVAAAALDTLAELAAEEDHPISQRLGAWTLLRDQRGETPEELSLRLQEAALEEDPTDPSQVPALWALFQLFPNSRDQERCVSMLKDLIPDDEEREANVLKHLSHAAPGMVRSLVAELIEKKRTVELAALYGHLLSRPTRNPILLVTLAALAENGKMEGEWPVGVHRLQSLIRLAVYLEATRVGDVAVQRAHTRLTAMLTSGAPSVMARLLDGVDSSMLRSTLNLAERGIDSGIENALVAIIAEKAPELFREGEKAFWETGLWTTRDGLNRREAEFKELMDVKLPNNSEAIGKAAAFGDLSENSEWEAAIEEQRNLTARASEMESEIRDARLLNEVSLPEDTAAPGTTVCYLETETGDQNTIRILGPWDQDAEESISYRAPLAAGMLGLHTGETGVLELPSGKVPIKIVSIEPIPLEYS